MYIMISRPRRSIDERAMVLLLVFLSLLVVAIPSRARLLQPEEGQAEHNSVARGYAATNENPFQSSVGAGIKAVQEDERRLTPSLSVWIPTEDPPGARAQTVNEEDFSSLRDYLNGLVAMTTTMTAKQQSNIAFVKTHKTASTTLAYILFRYARRHNQKLAQFDDHNSAIPLNEAAQQTRAGKGRVDIMHYHISVFGTYDGTWRAADENYRQIMTDPDHINFITVMREPRTHFLSYYYYFMQPATQKSIEEFLMGSNSQNKAHNRLFNPLAQEFGVSSKNELRQLVRNTFSQFKLIILTEQFDEGLMVLRRLMGWEMIDMSYCAMLKTKEGASRYDGKPLVNVPHFEDLPLEVQNTIDRQTAWDQILYKAAQAEYAKRRESVVEYLEKDLAEFEELNNAVSTYLEANTSSLANIMYKTENIYRSQEKSPLYPF